MQGRPYQLDATDINTTQGRADWMSLLATVNDRLVLLAKRDDDLTRHADCLHDRTGRTTGDLMNLLRRGANEAVGTTERLTKTLLDGIRLSEVADRQSPTGPAGLPDHAAAQLGRAIQRVQRAAR